MALLGMETTQARAAVVMMQNKTSNTAEILAQIEAAVAGVEWHGADADVFRSRFKAAEVTLAQDRLNMDVASTDLQTEIDQQESASRS